MSNQVTLQTVERALTFIEYVAAASEPPSVKDVSEALDLNITTCYHLLRTLSARNYIQRDVNGNVLLGDAIGNLFRIYQGSLSVEAHLSDVVKRLCASTLETSFLSLKEDTAVTIKVLIEGTQRLRVAGLYVGLSGHEYRRAAGKAVLANLPKAEQRKMLTSSLSGLPKVKRAEIMKDLELEFSKTADHGWYTDEGDYQEGISAIGVPFFDSSGAVLGAIGIVVPTFRMEKSKDRFLNAVLQAAAEATQMLKDQV